MYVGYQAGASYALFIGSLIVNREVLIILTPVFFNIIQIFDKIDSKYPAYNAIRILCKSR